MPIVRLVIDQVWLAKAVRLQDLPERGELIALQDGTRVIVTRVAPSPSGLVEAEVRARLVADQAATLSLRKPRRWAFLETHPVENRPVRPEP